MSYNYNIYFPQKNIEKVCYNAACNLRGSDAKCSCSVGILTDHPQELQFKIIRTYEIDSSITEVPPVINAGNEVIYVSYDNIKFKLPSYQYNWTYSYTFSYTTEQLPSKITRWRGETIFTLNYQPKQTISTAKFKMIKIDIPYGGYINEQLWIYYQDSYTIALSDSFSSADEEFNGNLNTFQVLSPKNHAIEIKNIATNYNLENNYWHKTFVTKAISNYTDSDKELTFPFNNDDAKQFIKRELPSWWGTNSTLTTIDNTTYTFVNKKTAASFLTYSDQATNKWGNIQGTGNLWIAYDPIKRGIWITDTLDIYLLFEHKALLPNWSAETGAKTACAQFYPTKTIGIDVVGGGAGGSNSNGGGGGAYFRAILNLEQLGQVFLHAGDGGKFSPTTSSSWLGEASQLVTLCRAQQNRYDYYVNDYGTTSGGELYPKINKYTLGISLQTTLSGDMSGQNFDAPYTTAEVDETVYPQDYCTECWVAHGGGSTNYNYTPGHLTYCWRAYNKDDRKLIWQTKGSNFDYKNDTLLGQYWDGNSIGKYGSANLSHIAFLNRYYGKYGSTSTSANGGSFGKSDNDLYIYSMILRHSVSTQEDNYRGTGGISGKTTPEGNTFVGGGASALGNGGGATTGTIIKPGFGGGGAGYVSSTNNDGGNGRIILHLTDNEGIYINEVF